MSDDSEHFILFHLEDSITATTKQFYLFLPIWLTKQNSRVVWIHQIAGWRVDVALVCNHKVGTKARPHRFFAHYWFLMSKRSILLNHVSNVQQKRFPLSFVSPVTTMRFIPLVGVETSDNGIIICLDQSKSILDIITVFVKFWSFETMLGSSEDKLKLIWRLITAETFIG